MLQIGLGWFPEQPGGLDRYYHRLLAQLQAQGWQVRGLVAGSDRAARESGGRVRSFASPRSSLPSRWLACRRAIREEIARRPPALVASHFALYAFPALSQIRHLPHVVHFHGPWAEECRREGDHGIGNRFKHWIESGVYRSADGCITLSNAFKRVLVERYGVCENRIRVIPGGVDCDRFDCGLSRADARTQLAWPHDRPIVLCVRRLVRRMGLENLIHAVAETRRKCPDVLILIAGKGPLRDELQARIAGLGLADAVTLLGYVPDEQLPLAYRAADLSIVPTESLEGFGLITLESLAAGTPVLVTPIGGLPEAVEGLSGNLILPSSGASSLAEGLMSVLTGKRPLPSAEECRRYAKGQFDWPVIASRVSEAYHQLVHG